MGRVAILVVLSFLVSSCASSRWMQTQTGTTSNFFGVWFTSNNDGWVVGQNGTFMRTTDGGNHWQEAGGLYGRSVNLNKIMFTDPEHGWIVGDFNTILATTDGGVTWHAEQGGARYGANYYGIFKLKSNGPDEIWIAGGNNTDALTSILKKDDGRGWDSQLAEYSGRLVRIFFLNRELGWAVGDNGLIVATTDGGASWVSQQSHTDLGLNDVVFFDEATGVSVGTDGIILRTTDGGAHWDAIRSTPGIIIFRLALVGNSTAYAVGTGNTILKSTDLGKTWIRQKDEAPANTAFEDVHFLTPYDGWAVGHDGVIVHFGK